MSDNPFSEEYAESCYEQLQTVEDEVIEDMERPQLVTFRLTGRPNSTDGDDDSEFLNRLMMSSPAVTDALNHILMGWKEIRWSVIGEEGDIPVWYLNVYMDSDLGRYDFMRVIHRHVDHSPVAFRQDHDYEDSIIVRNIGGSNPLVESETLVPLRNVNSIAGSETVADVPMGTYVTSHLLGFRDDTDDCERLQRTISASNVDSQWLPGPTFDETYEEVESDWNPEHDIPEGVETVHYGVGKYITGDECLSNGLSVKA